MFTLVVCATTSAWAANKDGSLNYAVTSNGSSLSVVVDDRVWHNNGGTWGASVMDDVSEAQICITPSDILPSGTKVNVSSLELGLNSTNDGPKHSSTITINSVTSQQKSVGAAYSSTIVLNNNGGGQGVKITYQFSGLTLEVGKSYAITFSDDATERKFMCVTSANGASILRGFKASSAEKTVMFKLTGTISYAPEAASISSDTTWGEGSLADFPGDDASGAYKINVTDDATITIPASTTAAYLTLNVSADKTVTLASEGFNAAAIFVEGGSGAKADFSGPISAATTSISIPTDITSSVNLGSVYGSGRLTLDAATSSIIADDTVKSWLTSGTDQLTVTGYGANGLTAEWEGNIKFTTHTTFDGGTHSLDVIQSSDAFKPCGNSSNSDPLWRVKNGTILNFKGKDFGGWTGQKWANECVIAVDNGGRLNLKDNGSNTFYCNGRFLLAPGATMDVETKKNNFILRGSADSGYEQIYVPDQDTDTTATPAVISVDGDRNISTSNNGFGIYVGLNAKLDWSAPINRSGGNILKSGAGTLTLKNMRFENFFTGSEGTIELASSGDRNDSKHSHTFQSSPYSGKLKVTTDSTAIQMFGWVGASSFTGKIFTNRPVFEANGDIRLYQSTAQYPFTVKNLSGSGQLLNDNDKDNLTAYKYFDTLQTEDTEYSGAFKTRENVASAADITLTVRGEDNSVHSLTLSGVSDTAGPLTIENNAKVVFSSTGKWSGGTVVVKNGGVLESQNSTAVAAKLKVEEGATLVFADGVQLKATAYDWSAISSEGSVNIDLSAVAPSATPVTLIASGVTVTADKFTVSDSQCLATLSVDNGALKATFANYWRDGTWGGATVANEDATLYISRDSTLTVSGALTLGTVTVVKEGEDDVTLTISGTGALTTGGWTIPAGVTVVTADGMEISGDVTGGGIINVPANTTLTMDGVTTSGDTLADRVKVTVSGTLKTKGTTTLSAANTSAAGSLIEVVNGVTTLSSSFRGLSGNITIQSDGELKFAASYNASGKDQSWDYLGTSSSNTVKVYGTLNMPNCNLWLRANNTLELYQGAEVLGSGYYASYYGSLIWAGNASLKAYGDAEINATITTVTDCSPVFNVEENKTLTISTAFIGQAVEITSKPTQISGGSITKAGAGTLDLTAITPTKPITIEAGTVVADVVPTAQVTINENGTFELKDCGWTGSGNVFAGEGTLYLNTRSGFSSDRITHDVSGATFSGILKIGIPSDNQVYFNGNPEAQLTGSPALRLECGTKNSQGELWVGAPAAGKKFKVKNLSGWAYIVPWSKTAGIHYFDTLQTDDTTFSGSFKDWNGTAIGSGNFKTGLTVKGDSVLKSLTLAAANDTTGPLEIQNKGKVIFSGSGSWLNGTTTVKSGGVLESQRDAPVVGNLTLEAGSTLSFAEGYSLQVGAITLPASGIVTLDVSDLTLSSSGTTLMTFSTAAPSASDVVNKMTVSGATLKLENSTLKAYPVATVTDSGSGAVVAYPSVQAAIDNASALKNQYVTAYQSETVTAAGYILLKIDGDAVVTLNSSRAGYAYNDGTSYGEGIYMFSDNVQVAATFKWKPAVASGTWWTTDNWTSDDGTVSRIPGSLDTVIFESDATVETPASGFSFAALQANASVTIQRDRYAILEGLTRTVSAYGEISGTGSLTLNDGVNLANASGASLSIGVPVTVAGATALTVAEGVAASFTGSGTLTLDAPTSTSIVGDDWRGTVVLPAGALSSPLNFNLYGNSESVVQITGAVSGYLPDAEIVTTVKIPSSASLTLTSFSPSFVNTFDKIVGEGALSVSVAANASNDLGNAANWGDGYNYSAYLLIKDVSKFTGSLTANQAAGIAIGAKPHKNTVGGKIIVSSGKTATVGASSTWTAGTIEVNGNVSVASGGALSADTIAGSGEISLAALVNSAMSLGNWTGTVVLPAIESGAIIFNNYGKTGSTVRLTSMSSGAWIQVNNTTINPKLYLAGNMTLSSMSPKTYTFAEIDGPGDLSFASSADSQPTAINITKVAEGYSGTISSALTTPVTIRKRNLSTLPACDDKVLAVGGTGTIRLDVSNIKFGVNEESLPAKYKVERRPEGEEGDGFYVYYNGTIFSVW